jgi:alpha-tubulin suppressor-like RCC1 family protein
MMHEGQWISMDADTGTNLCGVTTAYEAMCWGNNARGAIGTGIDPDDVAMTNLGFGTPQRVVNLGASFSMISVGDQHACGVDARDGAIWCWGRNINGQLGLGANDDGPHSTPARVVAPAGLSDTGWMRVWAGGYYTFAERAEGIFSWGANGDGQLAVSSGNRSTPALSMAVGPWTTISGADRHACGLRPTGEILCWGAFEDGRLGIGTVTAGVRDPTPIAEPLP